MKITTNKPIDTFKPVTVSFTFETQVELDTVGSLFNICAINDSLDKFTNTNIEYWNYFKSVGANVSNTHSLINEIIKHPSVKNSTNY